MSKYPMLDQIAANRDKSQTIRSFLNWLRDETDYRICEWYDEGYYPTYGSTEGLLAEYFSIDEKQAEAERQALLDEFLREEAE